jgi:hypothetical protein
VAQAPDRDFAVSEAAGRSSLATQIRRLEAAVCCVKVVKRLLLLLMLEALLLA